jgi:hypothetical protein
MTDRSKRSGFAIERTIGFWRSPAEIPATPVSRPMPLLPPVTES